MLFLVSAVTCKNDLVLKHISQHVRKSISDNAFDVALACAIAMTLNNYGFRAKHWLGKDFDPVRFGLRNTVSLKQGVCQADYELWAISVSAVNGCEQCIEAHSADAQAEGLQTLEIWEAVKIAAVVQAAAVAISSESVLGEISEGKS